MSTNVNRRDVDFLLCVNFQRETKFSEKNEKLSQVLEEEIFIIEGCLWDEAQNCKLRKGHDAYRAVDETYGSFRATKVVWCLKFLIQVNRPDSSGAP